MSSGNEELSSIFLFSFAVNQCIFSLMYQQSVLFVIFLYNLCTAKSFIIDYDIYVHYLFFLL